MTSRRVLLCALLAAACGRGERHQPDSATADTLSVTGATGVTACGTLRVVGSEPDIIVQLESSSGASQRLIGDATRTLRFLSALGVCVTSDSTATGERAVRSFVVRSQDGQPAVDGILIERAGAFFVRSADATETSLTTVPDPLRREVNARVWVVRDSAGRVRSFGVIR